MIITSKNMNDFVAHIKEGKFRNIQKEVSAGKLRNL